MVRIRLLERPAARHRDGGWQDEKYCGSGHNDAALGNTDLGPDWHIVVVATRVDVHGGLKLFAFFDWRVDCRGGYGVVSQ